ncbi:septum formation initiator family protein, partial [Kingella kingae]
KQQNDMLRRENEMLRAEVQDLENGFDTKAEIARSEMGYIGDGEIFYNLKPD